MYNRQWHSKWPINKNTQKKIPELIRFEFETSGKAYTWIMEPNVDYESKTKGVVLISILLVVLLLSAVAVTFEINIYCL